MVEEWLDDLIGCEITALDIYQVFVVATQSVEDVYGVCGRTVIVAPHHRTVVSVGPDDGDALVALGIERQNIITVFQQHERLSRHVERELSMLFA